MTVQEKLKVLNDTAIKSIEKQFGENSYYLGKKKMANVPTLCSTGSLSLDAALTIGGFPEGRIIEIGGQESSGKTTLTLIVIAECQRQGMLCAFLDAEQSFDPVYAHRLGVNVQDLLIMQPDTAEEGFTMAHEIIKSGVVSLLVVDSTNSMIPKRIFEGDVGESPMGAAARLFSSELPKIRTECTNHKCTAIFLSQVRSKIGVTYGSPDVVGVGNAMKFYASVRIKTSKADLSKDDLEGQTSVDVVMNVFKNKVGVPFKKAQFTLLTDAENNKFGIDYLKEVVDFAVKYEFIKKAGAWFTYGEEKFQGLPRVKDYLESNNLEYEKLKNRIIEKLKEENAKGVPDADSFSAVMEKDADDIEEAIEKKKRSRKSKDGEPLTALEGIDLSEKAIEESIKEIKEAEVVEEEK